MSEFQGLHNPERHKSVSGEWAECLPELGGCLSECGDGDPCRCCLAAEVERLTAIEQRVQEQIDIWQECASNNAEAWVYIGAAAALLRDVLRGESYE